ncbi:kelch-like protein 38 [Babylonia areolata]|uniref:kelch-like protein 38 n=1 Tax=Babylonia areolata TaxID=304850 RepID=UPI003FD07121
MLKMDNKGDKMMNADESRHSNNSSLNSSFKDSKVHTMPVGNDSQTKMETEPVEEKGLEPVSLKYYKMETMTVDNGFQPQTGTDPVENNVEPASPSGQGSISSLPVSIGTEPGDIIINTGDKRFCCHKRMLVQHSQFFRAMFDSGMRESLSGEIHLENTSSDVFRHLLDYFYTGQLDLTPCIVQEMTQLSHHLQVGVVLNQCCDLLVSMVEDDLCLSLMRLSNMLMLPEVYNTSRRHALWHFPHVCQTEDFTLAPRAQIIDYLQDPHLNIDSEVDVFRAAAVWFCAQEQACGVTDVGEFFGKVVNFHLMTDDDVALVEDLPEVGKSRKLTEFVASLRQKDVLTALSSKDPSRVRTSPRNSYILCVGGHQCNPAYCESTCLTTLGDKKLNCPMGVLGFEPETCAVEHVASLSDCFPPMALDSGYRVCAIGHLVYVVGGEASLGRTGGWLKTMWCLDSLRWTWHEVGTLKTLRRHHGLCAHGSTLFLIGGIGRFRIRLDSVESFDTVTKEWEALPDLLYQETSPAATVHRDCIYVFKNYVQVLDLSTLTWTYLQLTGPIPGLPLYAHPHPDPAATNAIFISCFNSESLWLVNLDRLESQQVTKFQKEGGGGVLCQGLFYHFQLNDARLIGSNTLVEGYRIDSGQREVKATLCKAMLTSNFVTVPRFPRYTPSSKKHFC